ncbi:MAG: nucleoside triphosphate pyrophosphohydrolase [Pseudomonadota bacterium]
MGNQGLASKQDAQQSPFETLVTIMAQLRDPDTGCPWDVEQDFASIAPYTIEEAYEVADAIERGDMMDLRDELGDLLLQVVFHSQMASEDGQFTIDDVAMAINEKMIRRHPHVFGSDTPIRSSDDQKLAWEDAKAQERALTLKSDTPASALDGIAKALPSLMRAEKLQKRAARTGFDWTDPTDIFDKLDEETAEVKEAMANSDQDQIEEEIGDLLFVCANLARRLSVDPETALSKANQKFEKRFRMMEALAEARQKSFPDLSLDEQEALWQEVKRRPKPS